MEKLQLRELRNFIQFIALVQSRTRFCTEVVGLQTFTITHIGVVETLIKIVLEACRKYSV